MHNFAETESYYMNELTNTTTSTTQFDSACSQFHNFLNSMYTHVDDDKQLVEEDTYMKVQHINENTYTQALS